MPLNIQMFGRCNHGYVKGLWVCRHTGYRSFEGQSLQHLKSEKKFLNAAEARKFTACDKYVDDNQNGMNEA